MEFLQQVEDDVRLEFGDRAAQRREVVDQAERARLVTQLAQPLQHVVLGLQLEEFLLAQLLDVLRRNEVGMHEHEDAVLAQGLLLSGHTCFARDRGCATRYIACDSRLR